MNKKFSTLVAVLLAAGAWTTMDAKVVTVATPEVGGTYLIGTDAGADASKLKGALIDASTTTASNTDLAVTFTTPKWTLEEIKADNTDDYSATEKRFYLKNDKGEYACVAAGDDAVVLETTDFATNEKLVLKLDGGKMTVAKAATKGSTNAQAVGSVLGLNSTAFEVLASNGTAGDMFDTFANFTAQEVGLTDCALVKDAGSEYYFLGAEDAAFTGVDKLLKYANNEATMDGSIPAGDAGTAYDAYLWKISLTSSDMNGYTYSFTSKANPKFSLSFVSKTKYANGFSLTGNNAAGSPLLTGAEVLGLYQSKLLPQKGGDLNALLGTGFNLNFKVKKDDTRTVELTDAFGGVLTAVKYVAPVGPATTPTYPALESTDVDASFLIKSGDNFLVLDTKSGASQVAGFKGEFKLVEEKDLSKDGYLSYFQVKSYYGNDNSIVNRLVAYADKTDADAGTNPRAAYIITTSATSSAVLTATDKTTLGETESWPYISLTSSNYVDVKTLLGKYWNISYAESKEAAKEQKEEYKLNGVLVPTNKYAQGNAAADVADYVNAGTVLLSSPETQWAVVKANATNNQFTLQNRETNVTVENIILRETNTPNVYLVQGVASTEKIYGDSIKLTPVTKVEKFDGYKKSEVNALRNQVYNIGQYHNETGNIDAYWSENHGGSHQLGLVTEDAVEWRLSLDTKADEKKKTEVDTVYVVTKFATLQKDGSIKNEATPDTLAILPYLFQNKSNLEYVKYKEEGFNYYVCDEEADVKDNGVRFALKAKPNGYNIVVLPVDGGKKDNVGTDKVYAGNSVQWGALTNMNTYAKDDNSIMVVEEIAKPEYRKVAKEWGDIVKIFREEYPTEVLFEKRDAKSVVDKDTLSFLNVNNSVTGANPALFVDTAYVNRVDANGVANTCYQYLLGVNVDKDDTYYCPYNPEHNSQAWRDEHNGGKPCADAMEHQAVKGRFLINLVDTAFAYKQEHLHNNPYVNNVEAYEHLAKLAFVEGIHANDTLYITRKGGEVVKLAMDDPNFNVAKFAFRYVDNKAGSFKIQTQSKLYDSSASQTLKDFNESAHNEGYLRWVNGTVVVTNSFLNGETFNMEENFDGQAVANEDITTSSISVIASEGKVIINGAAGKKVTISNVLGQTIANAVLSSDNATIAAPQGVVVVAVEGEAAVKAIVK
nr:DUF6383 domain-containing protein [Parabacteroides goldsteinii]